MTWEGSRYDGGKSYTPALAGPASGERLVALPLARRAGVALQRHERGPGLLAARLALATVAPAAPVAAAALVPARLFGGVRRRPARCRPARPALAAPGERFPRGRRAVRGADFATLAVGGST
jgi:hypothetical protein